MPAVPIVDLAVAGLTFTTGWRHALGPYCPRHSHAGFELVLHVAGGGLTTTATGASQAFGDGDAVLYGPGVAHDQRADGPGEEWCIQAAAARPLPGIPDLVHVAACADPYVVGEAGLLTRLSPDEMPARREELGMRVTALLMRVLALGSPARERLRPQAQRYAEAARDWLRARFREPHCLEEVATAVGVGIDHLRHCFRREYGTGMARYVISLRLAHAKDLLAHSNLPLQAIAEQCGYASDRYLCRVFQQWEGVPPGRFRRG
jgi:AraC-like DNA-binding protein